MDHNVQQVLSLIGIGVVILLIIFGRYFPPR